mgnify:CR=1 FL=1
MHFWGHLGQPMRAVGLKVIKNKLQRIRASGGRWRGDPRDRRGQFSIRINDQYRVCFVWTQDGPDRVGIVDYH